MKCEKCGTKLNNLLLDMFNFEGADHFVKHPIVEYEENAVTVDTEANWAGYELAEEEMPQTICCPYCKQFPFENKEVQVQNIVRIICFKGKDEKLKEEKLEYPIVTVVSNNCEVHSKTSQDYDDLIANIKKEAYKEFADELKKYAFTNASEDGEEVVEVEDIENVLKELGVDKDEL